MDFSSVARGFVFGLAAFGAALPVAAQTTPKIEISAGYQLLNLDTDGDSESLPKGWYVDVAGNLNRYLGVVFEVGGNYKSVSESATFMGVTETATVDLRVHEFMGGTRVTSRANATVMPFGQVLVGAVNGSAKVTASSTAGSSTLFSFNAEENGTNFGLQAGGGAQLRITDRIGFRFGVDYLRIFADEGDGNAFRFAAGVVLAR
jgi:opacity protein-like surface antigen